MTTPFKWYVSNALSVCYIRVAITQHDLHAVFASTIQSTIVVRTLPSECGLCGFIANAHPHEQADP